MYVSRCKPLESITNRSFANPEPPIPSYDFQATSDSTATNAHRQGHNLLYKPLPLNKLNLAAVKQAIHYEFNR